MMVMIRGRNRILRVILPIIGVLVFSGSIPARGATRIMPLGDSITKGWYGSSYYWGYRKPLYDLLTNDGYSFDFVGVKSDGSFPDPDHEGRNGWRADEILDGRTSVPAEGKLADWLIEDQPDVILLHIGTNDVTADNQDANEVNSILDVIDGYEVASGRHVMVILALIINRRVDSPAIKRSNTTQYNVDLIAMATNRIANGDDIIIVDMESALNYGIGVDMADELHPNDAGYAKMANVWYGALADYFGEIVLSISGYVVEPDGNTPVEGMLIRTDNNDVNAATDANGFYELYVDYNWSGAASPQKDGFIFEPNGYIYTDVNQDLSDMDYIAAPLTFKITGFVLEQNSVTPLNDVYMSADNGSGAALTDSNGYYELVVNYNYTGNVTPGKYAYVFEPNSRHYEGVIQNYTADQNYTGTEFDFRITGFVRNVCNVPVEGVLFDANNGGNQGTTDSNGFYEVWVDEGWSGTVTLAKTNYTFEPVWMSYIEVSADPPNQDYIASNVYDLDCDSRVGWGDVKVMADNWLSTDPGNPCNFVADGCVDFRDFVVLVSAWED
jgi:lysophospholipase L1-like esterase